MKATAPAPPDAQQLTAEPLAAAPFPGRAAGLRVFFDQSVHNAIAKHAAEDTSVEICGVVVGQWKKDEGGGPYVHITASIRGDAAASKTAEVTFTHETWAKINKKMDEEFTDRRIVGWYHTHPDFGIFLSDRDVFIHQHFFSAPGQIAFVVDPIRREEGVFVWENGTPTLTPTHWVGDGQRWAPRSSASDAPMRRGSGEPTEDRPVHAATSAATTQQPLSLLSVIAFAVVAAALVAGGYFFATYNQQQQHVLVAQALAEQLYNKTSSPETRKSLAELRSLLSEIADETSKLTEPKKEGVEPPKPERISAAINQRLARAGVELNRAVEAQSLTPEQQAAIDWFVAQRLQATVDQAIKDLIARGVLTATKPSPDPSTKDAKPAAPDKPAPSSAPPTDPKKEGK